MENEPIRAHIGPMGNTFAGGVQIVEVTTDGVKEHWAAATSRENAVALVAGLVPPGSDVELTTLHIKAEHVARLKLRPGEAKRANS